MAGAGLVNVPPRQHGSALAALGLLGLLSGVGCLPPAQPPLTVWAVDGSEALTPDSPPLPETAVFSASQRHIHLTAAINETGAFQLALRTPTQPAGPFAIEISNLYSPGGKLAARDTVTLYRVYPVRIDHFRSWYPQHTGRLIGPG